MWYAVLVDFNDTDWGYGSHSLQEAERLVEGLHRDGYPDAYIAIIAEGSSPVCVGEIH